MNLLNFFQKHLIHHLLQFLLLEILCVPDVFLSYIFQEQKIYVVQSEEGLSKIDKATPCRYGASTCVVVAFDSNHVFTYPGEKRDSGVEDATIVATHMILAAANTGVDSCWINFFNPEELAKELNLPENEEILMILDLGYAAEGAGPLANHDSRKELSETVSYL